MAITATRSHLEAPNATSSSASAPSPTWTPAASTRTICSARPWGTASSCLFGVCLVVARVTSAAERGLLQGGTRCRVWRGQPATAASARGGAAQSCCITVCRNPHTPRAPRDRSSPPWHPAGASRASAQLRSALPAPALAIAASTSAGSDREEAALPKARRPTAVSRPRHAAGSQVPAPRRWRPGCLLRQQLALHTGGVLPGRASEASERNPRGKAARGGGRRVDRIRA